jgi:Protein of unknown function (DUF2934)
MNHNELPDVQNEKHFVPSSVEVASRAYFNYVNQGSPTGHDTRHWLDAEAELVAEYNFRLAKGHRAEMLAAGCRQTAEEDLAQK